MMFKAWDNCWSKGVIEEWPGFIKDRYAQVFAWVLFTEANNSLKPDIQPGGMSRAVSVQALEKRHLHILLWYRSTWQVLHTKANRRY